MGAVRSLNTLQQQYAAAESIILFVLDMSNLSSQVMKIPCLFLQPQIRRRVSRPIYAYSFLGSMCQGGDVSHRI